MKSTQIWYTLFKKEKESDSRTTTGLPAVPFQLQEVPTAARVSLIRKANSAPRPSATSDPAGQRTETGLEGHGKPAPMMKINVHP